MRWLNGTTDLMYMGLGELRELVTSHPLDTMPEPGGRSGEESEEEAESASSVILPGAGALLRKPVLGRVSPGKLALLPSPGQTRRREHGPSKIGPPEKPLRDSHQGPDSTDAPLHPCLSQACPCLPTGAAASKSHQPHSSPGTGERADISRGQAL